MDLASKYQQTLPGQPGAQQVLFILDARNSFEQDLLQDGYTTTPAVAAKSSRHRRSAWIWATIAAA